MQRAHIRRLINKFQSHEKNQDMKVQVGPYFGGLKDSPTCRHNLHEVTYS